MPKRSAGILLLKKEENKIFFLIVHPGGPYWVNRDKGSWTIPKGLMEDGETAIETAKREWMEETGFPVPSNPLHTIDSVKLRSGKTVYAFAAQGNADPKKLHSNLFSMEWPRKSGIIREFPEIDRAMWCTESEAEIKLNPALIPLLERAKKALGWI